MCSLPSLGLSTVLRLLSLQVGFIGICKEDIWILCDCGVDLGQDDVVEVSEKSEKKK